jgi:transposase-like protein
VARASYTDEDKARVFTVLTVNEGNIKRTAREVGVPYTTVSDWKKEWEKSGGPPPSVEAKVAVVATQMVDRFTHVRDMALDKVAELIPQATERNIPALTTLVGVLTDKIDRANGLDKRKIEVEHTIQTPEEVSNILKGLVIGAVAAANERHEIIDAEVVEQAPLALNPPA